MNLRYFIKKLVQSLVTIWIVLTISFILFRAMPGDPVSMFVKSDGLDPQVARAIVKQYGLNLPLHKQYLVYIKDMLGGNFGQSFSFKKPVLGVIGQRLPNTIILALAAQILAMVFGILLGTIAAAKRGKKIDVILLGSALFIYAIPAFWLGIILLSYFGVKLGAVPLFGMLTPGLNHASKAAYYKDVAHHIILPAITFGLAITGRYAMIMRGSLLDIFTEDYITTARAKGFDRKYIIKKHALPNAMLPMVTVIAISLGFVVAGAIQVETVFSWPGVGTLTIKALQMRDYPLLQGVFLIISFCVVTANFIADIVYMYIDPRIKYE
jgi:peptide/nickel transport system permease protein